jgi:hypothetical protein
MRLDFRPLARGLVELRDTRWTVAQRLEALVGCPFGQPLPHD